MRSTECVKHLHITIAPSGDRSTLYNVLDNFQYIQRVFLNYISIE